MRYSEDYLQPSKHGDRAAALMFQALQNTLCLRRFYLSLLGNLWQPVFSKFLRQHSKTLRYLVLYDITLEGDWQSMLHDIAESTRDRREYLCILDPHVVRQGTKEN